MRIFLDANILFSAAHSDGAMRALLAELVVRGHELRADDYVAEEAARNLATKNPAAIAALETVLQDVTVTRVPAERSIEANLPLPEKDRPILASAISQACQALVTGDRTHFGSLYGKTIRGVAIHSPRSIAETLVT
jgi:uncharacterized protein